MRFMLPIALALGLATPVVAQTMSAGMTISMVRTGWNLDAFAIQTAAPVLNPAGCPTPDGYISDQSLPGYRTYLTAALAAFSMNTPVVITVHDGQCFAGRPVLIGLNLFR
jgi:hypothetical protein